MSTYRVWYGYELEVDDELQARLLADDMKISSDPKDAPTFAYVEEVDQ